MSTKSYAKRGALCDALNISIDHNDDDARLIGDSIDEATAVDLERRVKECGANEEAFLKYAKADNYESIPVSAYERLDAMLKRKESKREDW
jgi:hypothetical protein